MPETITTSEAMKKLDSVDFTDAESTYSDREVEMVSKCDDTGREVTIKVALIQEIEIAKGYAHLAAEEWTIKIAERLYTVELDQPFNLLVPASTFDKQSEVLE